MSREFVLWGVMPNGTRWGTMPKGVPIKISSGTAAHCRRELAVRAQGTYWRGLAIYAAGTAYPPELLKAVS